MRFGGEATRAQYSTAGTPTGGSPRLKPVSPMHTKGVSSHGRTTPSRESSPELPPQLGAQKRKRLPLRAAVRKMEDMGGG